MSRTDIDQFCWDFLQGNNTQLHEIVIDYKPALSRIDIRCLDFTQDTFDETFQRICKTFFTAARPVKKGYVIALLGFAVEIDVYHHTCSWYNIDILVRSLINALKEIDFHPDDLLLKPAYCILL